MKGIEKTVAIRTFERESKNFLALGFKYDNELIALAKSIGCRWDLFHKTWYILRSHENLQRIQRAFKGKAVVKFEDFSSTSARSKRHTPKKSIPEEYRNLLIRKRYSSNTIKVYTSMFQAFLNYFADKDLDVVLARLYERRKIEPPGCGDPDARRLAIDDHLGGVEPRRHLSRQP